MSAQIASMLIRLRLIDTLTHAHSLRRHMSPGHRLACTIIFVCFSSLGREFLSGRAKKKKGLFDFSVQGCIDLLLLVRISDYS